MASVKLEKFGGMLPAWDDHLLPDGQAALSQNCYLFSGALIGWRQPKFLRALADGSAKTVFRVPTVTAGSFDPAIAGAATWLEFADRETDVIRSPVVDDQFGRYYFASPSVVPKYNTYDRIVANQSAWLLGVPAPGCEPIVSVVGGGDSVTLGYPTANVATTEVLTGNQIALIPIQPDGDMSLVDVQFVPQSTLATVRYMAVLYADQGGVPGTLLNVGEIGEGLTAGAGAASAFQNPTGLMHNTKYWIGIAFDTDLILQVANADPGLGVVATNTFTNGPPSPPGSLSSAHPNWQMWGTLATGSILASRAYVYTWLTAYGEEGPPSPPTLTDGWSNGVWTVGLFMPPTDDVGVTRNITKKRLYRTVSSNTGETTFFFIAELDVAVDSYTDTSADNVIALNNQLSTTTFFPPPSDLKGIISLPNGMMAGFKANELWFCEPYMPHAWPPQYVLTTEFPIIGIGAAGQNVVACTAGTPYVASGINPGTLSLNKVKIPEPCISRGSILATDNGVYYCSPNGLILVNITGQASNVTEQWITRERWRALTPPKLVHAIKLASSYFAFGVTDGGDTSVAQQGFMIELSDKDAQSFSIWPQPGGHRIGFSPLTAPNGYNIDNLQVDPWTGIGLIVQNGGVYYYDFADQAPVIVPYKWRSKKYQQTSKKNFAAMKVFFTVPPGTPAQNGTRNVNDPQSTLATDQYGIIRVYGDNQLVTTREIRSSGELLRILSGFKVEVWQWEVEARVLISNFQVATSAKELGGV